jgi:hypothetical protein
VNSQLRVKINRFPRGVSSFCEWQVLRERQDANFDVEGLVVFGTMACRKQKHIIYIYEIFFGILKNIPP